MQQAEFKTGVIGIIGGSGFYTLPGISDLREVDIDTPFGKPSDPVVMGTLGGREVAFIARHGKGHRINPTNVPARANVCALKMLGVTHLISVSAVGSMKELIEPLDMVVPDQVIDRTVHRPRTFFEEGVVVHVALAHPYCGPLRTSVGEAATLAGATVHDGGTYICVEGPQFSTLAESLLYRSWDVSVIGMTAMPEARLAREAEMCYAMLAMATDYDTWHPEHDSVTVDLVVQNLNRNVETARNTLAALIPMIPDTRTCGCATALDNAIMTQLDALPKSVMERYRPLLARYIAEE
jgi:5'-methylthioadenosine phosphorylase